MIARDKGLGKLFFVTGVAVIGLTLTFVYGWSPLLGLDLQGGASVVLQPVQREGEAQVEVTDEALDQSIEIIRNRVDGLGVAEPDIRRQGDTIIVSLPGVDNQQRALELVGATAELRFRPVISVTQLPEPVPLSRVYPEEAPGGSTTTIPPSSASSTTVATGSSSTIAGPGATTTATTAGPGTTAGAAPDGEALGAVALGESALGAQGDPTTTLPGSSGSTSTVPATTTTTLPDVEALSEEEIRELDDQTLIALISSEDQDLSEAKRALIQEILQERADAQLDALLDQVTAPEADVADQPVILPQVAEIDGERMVTALYQLGPTLLTGDALSGAEFTQRSIGEWVVNPTFRAGADGIDKFNAAAALCFGGANPDCPAQQGGTNGQLGIVLDSIVISAPEINTASFERDRVEISGTFDRDTAADLALQLRYGSLPIELEPQSVETISASVGEDALVAGVIAGFVGLGLVAIFVISYYRLLGVIAVLSLIVSSAILWSIISYLGDNRGLALTLAGVTGIIVSLGVSMDSNIVYFENLKEDVRNGRTFRASVTRSFGSSFATILKADCASLIAAGVLYFLTVGAVRGFAFYLGLATLLDLIASYMFMGPLVRVLGTSPRFYDRPGLFGMPPPREAAPAPPAEVSA